MSHTAPQESISAQLIALEAFFELARTGRDVECECFAGLFRSVQALPADASGPHAGLHVRSLREALLVVAKD